MPYVSDKTWEAVANVLFKLAAQNDRIVRMIQNLGPVDTSWSKRMEEELKALAEAIAEDRSVNSSAYKLIQELAGKIEKITAEIPANFRNRLVELTEELRNNSKELASGVAASTAAANEPPVDVAPAPAPAPEPVPAPIEPAPVVTDPVPEVTEPPAPTPEPQP